MTGLTSAQDFETTPQEYSFNITAGSTYTQNFTVEWTGSTSVVANMYTEIEAENTNPNGINVTYTPETVALHPNEPKTVDIKIDTFSGLKPDNFTFTTKVKTEYPVEVKDSGSDSTGDSPAIIDGGKETVIEYKNSTITVPEGSLNETQEERIRNILDGLNQSEQVQDQIIENLKGNLTSEQTENRKLSNKLSSYKFVIAGLSVTVLGLIMGLIALLSKKEGVRSIIEDLAGSEAEQ